MITLQEKIDTVELLIEEYEDVGVPQQLPSVLKAIAKDLRARLDGSPSVTETELGRRVTAVQLAKDRKAGNLEQRLAALGQEVVIRWPTIQAALAMFDARVEEER